MKKKNKQIRKRIRKEASYQRRQEQLGERKDNGEGKALHRKASRYTVCCRSAVFALAASLM